MNFSTAIVPSIKTALEKMQVSAYYIAAVGLCWYILTFRMVRELTTATINNDGISKAIHFFVVIVVIFINLFLASLALVLAIILITMMSVYLPVIGLIGLFKSLFK